MIASVLILIMVASAYGQRRAREVASSDLGNVLSYILAEYGSTLEAQILHDTFTQSLQPAVPREDGVIESQGSDYAMRFGNVKSSRLEDHGGSIEAQNLQNTLAQSFQAAHPYYYGGYAPLPTDYAMRFGNVKNSQLQDHGGSIEAHNLKNTLAQSFQPSYGYYGYRQVAAPGYYSAADDYAMRLEDVKSSQLQDHVGSIEAHNLKNTLAQSFKPVYFYFSKRFTPFGNDYAMIFGNVKNSQLQDHGGSIEAHNIQNTLAQSFQPSYGYYGYGQVAAPVYNAPADAYGMVSYPYGGNAPQAVNVGYGLAY